MQIDNAFGLSAPTLAIFLVVGWIICSLVICELANLIPRREITRWHILSADTLGKARPPAPQHRDATFSLRATERIVVFVVSASILVSLSVMSATAVSALSHISLLLVLLLLWQINRRHFILPDSVVIPMTWAGLLIHVFVGDDLQPYILGAVVGYLVLYLVSRLVKWRTGKEFIGHGDMKTLAMLGAWFGVDHLIDIYLLLLSLSVAGGIVLSYRKSHHPQPTGIYYFVIGLTMVFGLRILTLNAGS